MRLVIILMFMFHLNFSQSDSSFFYHISYNAGPLDHNNKNHILSWYTKTELPPKHHFAIEHFCWSRWVERARYEGKGRPGTGNYSGKIPGKVLYTYFLPPHSGDNNLRVVLVNDSNVRIAMTKELPWTEKFVEKVSADIKKKAHEIHFSSDTYYEIVDEAGAIVAKDYSKVISYATLPKGSYTLYYDNDSTTFIYK
jgi:hypothetical protein